MKFEFQYIDFSKSVIPKCKVHTLIPGDLHLGSESCRPFPLIEIIKYYKPQRIIFQGDTFENNRLRKLPKSHHSFLRFLRKSGIETVWLAGNHDSRLQDLLSRFYDKDVVIHKESRFVHDNISYGIIHGDQFDPTMRESYFWKVVVGVSTWFHNLTQRVHDGFAAWLKSAFKGPLLKVVDSVKYGALKYGEQNDLEQVICGHTHENPKHHPPQKEITIGYTNVGCFTEKICGVGLITERGIEVAQLVTFKKPRKFSG